MPNGLEKGELTARGNGDYELRCLLALELIGSTTPKAGDDGRMVSAAYRILEGIPISQVLTEAKRTVSDPWLRATVDHARKQAEAKRSGGEALGQTDSPTHTEVEFHTEGES